MIEKHQKLLSFSKQLLFRARGLALLSATSCRLSSGRLHLLTRASLPAFPPPWSAQITLRIPLFLFFQSLKQKSCLVFLNSFCFGQGGFEPPTSTSRTWRATNCAIARNGLNIKKPTPESRFYRDVRDSHPWSPA